MTTKKHICKYKSSFFPVHKVRVFIAVEVYTLGPIISTNFLAGH